MAQKISIRDYLRKKGYKPPGDDTYTHIDEWMEWYQSDVEKFHSFNVYNGIQQLQVQRKTLGMAKRVCEDWANLILNEKVTIKAGGFEKKLNEILEKNNFRVQGNQLIEIAYALGTGAFVEYMDGEKNVIVDYIRADMIAPLTWDNGDITECAFGSCRSIDGKDVYYIQIHRFGRSDQEDDLNEKEGLYYIENHYVDAETGEDIELPEGIIDKVDTGSEAPLFQIIMPCIKNNIELDSPMGISVYANAIDQLKGCDIVYDSYINEFVLGKKRVIVPISAAKVLMAQEGDKAAAGPPVFDPNDLVFYAMPGDKRDDLKLTENNMEIRSEDHENGIQRMLDLLSFKCGLGTGRYKFDHAGVKTATEIISDKDDLYQNLKKNEIPVAAAVIGMVKAIAFLSGRKIKTVSVNFDDSIIEDTNTTIDRNIKLVQSGLRSKLRAVMEINKCSEEEARKELDLVAQESQITGQDIDWTDSDDPEAEETEDREEKEGDEE